MVSIPDTLTYNISIKSNRSAARSRLSGNFRPSITSAALLSSRGSLPLQTRALAVLIPQRRGYATEPSTSPNSGGPSFPPPGFDPEQAKKPLNETSQKPSDLAAKDAVKDGSALSGVAKTKVDEAALAELETRKLEREKKVSEEKKEPKKLTIGQKIKKEAQHYWDGTKLLATEVRISTKLALKMAAGYELSRRENRQVRIAQVTS